MEVNKTRYIFGEYEIKGNGNSILKALNSAGGVI